MLGGTMCSPFTGVVFALEPTHDINALLPEPPNKIPPFVLPIGGIDDFYGAILSR
jgi:hypothetical protein